MKNYINLKSFFEDIFKELSCEYFSFVENSANSTQVLVRMHAKKFVLTWNVNNSLLNTYPIQHVESERLKTLFYNDIFFADLFEIRDINDIRDFIHEKLIKQDPDSRILSILEIIYETTPFAGNIVDIKRGLISLKEQHWRKLFFNTSDEFYYYMKAAKDMGYIDIASISNESYSGVSLTIPGFKAITDIKKEQNSKTCFVAMSFDRELREIYDKAIVPALNETGFVAVRIDDDHSASSDVTINDSMLAAIKKSKFTIADFTQHKKGVYFESGYALGRGQKVIYTCREDEINNAHFDTRNYPHIVWTDAEDLKKKLIDKIEIFIKI